MILGLLFLFQTVLSAEENARAEALFEEFRCVVCQNQSIAESDAELAQVMRALVEERIAAGDTDEEVRDFLTARYGEYVLLRPSNSAKNLALWIGPGIALVAGGFWAFSLFRSDAKAPE